jgi:hypothetical protein
VPATPTPSTLRIGAANVAALVVLATANGSSQDALNLYRGNLHAHSSYSDGSGTPDEAFEHAKQHLDFMALTEHNHAQAELGAGDRADGRLIATNPALYDEVKDAADRHTEDGSFVAFWGQEFSAISKGNHSNILQLADVIDTPNGAYRDLYDAIGSHLLQFNHPWDGAGNGTNYGLGQFHGSVPKLAEAAKSARLIEVINGPGTKNATALRADVKGESAYKFYLARGMKLAPTADQDNHYFTWGDLTGARTVVLAPALTRAALLDALRSYRCYASTDDDIAVTFTVNSRILGSDRTASSRHLKIHYAIEDPDEPKATYRVQVIYGNPKLHDSVKPVTLANTKGDHKGDHVLKTEHTRTFVYLRIVQHPDKPSKTDYVITAPLWITVDES